MQIIIDEFSESTATCKECYYCGSKLDNNRAFCKRTDNIYNICYNYIIRLKIVNINDVCNHYVSADDVLFYTDLILSICDSI